MADLLAAALAYTARGWPVLPLCWPAGGRCGCGRGHVGRDVAKAPLLGVGYQHLRADARQVRAWWRRWPSANVGLLLEPAELLIVDLDGRAAVAEADALGCPPTFTVHRGDHMHLLYARPADVRPGRRTKQGTCRAIDLLAAGYVVAAPSRHASGDTYTVARDVPPVEPPAWAVSWLHDGMAATPAAPVEPDADQTGALAEARHLLGGHRLLAVLEAGPDGAPGRYVRADGEPDRSAALAAVEGALLDAGIPPARVAAALLAVPWVAGMRRHAERWVPADVARIDARRLRLADPADALPLFRALPARTQALLASARPKRRAAGTVAAVRAGCPPSAVAAVLVAAGLEQPEAVALARWAAAQAARAG